MVSLIYGHSLASVGVGGESNWRRNDWVNNNINNLSLSNRRRRSISCKCKLETSTVALTAVVIAASVSMATAEPETTLFNIPQTLSGECTLYPKHCEKPKIQKPKSSKAESCTIKCVNTCIRGGQGSPGEGPLNLIRPLVVFKQGFRTRQYCLVECSDICNLISDAEQKKN